MRVVFINRFYRPDQSATSQICRELTGALVADGMDVTVITSRQCHDQPNSDLPSQELLSGVSVRRVWTTRFGRAGLVGRSLDYLSFYFFATLQLLRVVDESTVVVAMTDPPLVSVLAAWVVRYRRAHLVNWLQDFFPEVAQRLGVLKSGKLNALLRAARNWSLVRARHNVVIGDRMGAMVAAITGRTAVVIPNWALEEGEAGDASRLRSEWGLDGRFVVGYSGNLGRAHQLDVLIESAILLRGDARIVFLFVGDGAQRAGLEAQVARRGLRNVIFKPFQERERLRESLSLPDIHVVSLDPCLEGLIVPSKFVGVIALGKPVLWLGDGNGELGALVRDTGCGVAVRSDDATGLVAAIQSLNAGRLAAMGQAASQLWRDRFQREKALRRWQSLLKELS